MSAVAAVAAAIVLCTVHVGLLRVLRGPTAGDRMMSAQLMGTAGTATVLLLATALQSSTLIDVALVMALLAATASLAFVRCVPASRLRERTSS
ncbi:MAG: monovalent cation/H+ antiporter complex subunit F [Planctomycetota bacterium]|jgi:multicomponent Na+:H+ antiporter subunit F